jgi:hypothetical protein
MDTMSYQWHSVHKRVLTYIIPYIVIFVDGCDNGWEVRKRLHQTIYRYDVGMVEVLEGA